MQKKLLAVGVGVVDMLVKPMDSLDFETDAHTIDSFVMSSGGDTMNVTLWVVVAIASCAAIPAVVVVCRRRTSR